MDVFCCPCNSFQMAQTRDGALKIAAKRAGIPLADYIAAVTQGFKWCTGCKALHEVGNFGADKSRYDGLSAACLASRKRMYDRTYEKVPEELRVQPGRPPKAPVEGDKRQARRRINLLVRTGRLATPNSVPCFDCGHRWEPGGRRHEYDHFRGYASEHHLDVQVVCSRCHCDRELRRGKWGRKRR